MKLTANCERQVMINAWSESESMRIDRLCRDKDEFVV